MPAEPLDQAQLAHYASALANELAPLVQREAVGALHAFGLGLAAQVAQRVHERNGTPYFVTPWGDDWTCDRERFQTMARAALRDARRILVLDEESRQALETRLAPHPCGSLPDIGVVRRGVDLDTFKPIARDERPAAARALTANPELAARLDGIDWEHDCVVLCVEAPGDRCDFEQLLFAVPEVLRQQPALQVIVVTLGDAPPATDSLRAALAGGRAELLHDVLQTSELYQPLLDHLERLREQGRAEAWWRTAARLEPEHRLHFTGPVARHEFARILALAAVFVMPGAAERPGSQMLYEALACGVLPLAGEAAGIAPLARLVAAEVSGEIGALCVLRCGVQGVGEIEEKLGRILRLRPQLADRLRAVAVHKLDGRQAAATLHRLYGETAPAAVLPV